MAPTASAPTVQSLNDIIGQLTQAMAPEKASIDSQITANEQSGAGQVAGLNAAKDTAFKNIDQSAEDKGMYFSGYSPHEQASYLGATYMPKLAALQNTIATTRAGLLGKEAGLTTSINTGALDTRQKEQAALDAYNNTVSTNAANAYQKELDRQNALSIARGNNAATMNAASMRSSSAQPNAAALNAQQKAYQTQVYNAIYGGLKSGKSFGSDGYIAPQDYARAKQDWVANGAGTGSDFDTYFSGVRNPGNKYYALDKLPTNTALAY